ncbi:TPA: ead/Ea22-like family protein [Klebsiella quasipneumoniae subsp. quasipneumoniae]|nr:ead/Ea22-like family protein [Klebsiella quasipneumoniae subsp. quasipneumoniae]
MTTDITKLAQRMKAAAVRAKTATEEYASGHMSVSVCYAECEEFNRLTDGPDNILALVEALASEKRICATWRKTAEANSEKLEKAQAKADVYDMLRDDYGLREKGVGLVDFVDWQAKRIAELECEQEQLRPVGIMSEKAFHRLENSECRFIALWPRPGIFLRRKRPEDGVLVYARTAAAAGIKVEAE